MSAGAVKLVRAFCDYSAGRDLVDALADEGYVAAGTPPFDQLPARDFEFVRVRDEGGKQGVNQGPSGLVTGMRAGIEVPGAPDSSL